MTMVYGRYIELLWFINQQTSAWGWGTTLWVWYALSQGFFWGDPCTEAVPDGHLLQTDTLGPLLCNMAIFTTNPDGVLTI